MNILVSNISTFSFKKEERVYSIRVPQCCVKELSAFHTNESILKCVVELENVKQMGGLNRIIALVSNKALTAVDERFENLTSVEYYSNQARELCSNVEIVLINIEDENNKGREISAILSDICKNIQTNDVVYIDSAGGLRTISNVVQILTKILKYKGIENPCTLYSDIQNDSFITDTSSFNKITDLADAFNEFMTTGKANQLSGCFVGTSKESPFTGLINAMIEFSDRIRLGNVKDIDFVIKELISQVEMCKNSFVPNSIEGVMLMQFLPVIESKIVGSSIKGIDYVKIINWCLENRLIQQALTLFVEKLPIYVFNNEMIKYRFNVEKVKKEHNVQAKSNKTLPKDWETYAFYSDCLENRLREVQDHEISEFIDCLKVNRQSNTKVINNALPLIYSYRKKYPYSNVTDKRKCILDDFIKEKSKLDNYESFVNAICKNRDFVHKYLSSFSLADDKKAGDKTLTKKFDCVGEIKKKGFHNSNYTLNIKVEKLIEMYYAYIYAKALRNKINHASSDENLAEWQIDILSQHGYNFSFFDIESLKRNIEIALGHFAVDFPNTELSNLTDNTFQPTTMKVGDVIAAKVVNANVARIDGYNYDIQFVVQKPNKGNMYVEKVVNVEIRQISKAGKIIQVRLLL